MSTPAEATLEIIVEQRMIMAQQRAAITQLQEKIKELEAHDDTE